MFDGKLIPGKNNGLVDLAKTSQRASAGNGSGLKNSLKNASSKVGSFLQNASSARLNVNGLLAGALPKLGGKSPIFNFGIEGGQAGSISSEDDWRVRITAPQGGPFDFSAGPMSAIAEDSGVVFPYTPSITVSHSANYSNLSPTHSNYPSYFYRNSEVQSITISGDFTAQTSTDASYVLGMIYFFRSATKMFYGGEKAGNPPPILYLDGYGDYYLPHVPVVVTNFQHSMPNGIDYIECQVDPDFTTQVKAFGGNDPGSVFGTGLGAAGIIAASEDRIVSGKGGGARIPTMSNVSVTVQPIYSRNNISNKFTWEDFSKGNLLKGNGGFL